MEMNNITTQNRLGEKVPKALLSMMFALVVFILVAVSVARVSGWTLVGTPPQSEIVAKASLYLFSEKNKAVTVLSSKGVLLANLTGEEGGFVSDVARAVDQERRKQGVESNAPIEVIWRENGQISVYDPSTAWQADLMGFGADSSRAFAMLLAKAKKGE